MSAVAENIPITPGGKTISIPPDRTGLTRHIPLFLKARCEQVLRCLAVEDTDCAPNITILNVRGSRQGCTEELCSARFCSLKPD
jgi:hypothetical protein